MEGQFNARISRLERIKDSATEIPKPTAADAGKVVTVNQSGDGYVLAEGGGGGGGIQIIRPLKIKDLPPVPQGLTPKADYHMDDPEAYAPVYFLVGDYPSDDFTPVVANAGSNVVHAVSYFEMEMDDANILFLTPSSLVNGIPSQLEKPGDVETSSIAAITADTLPIQVIPASACERFLHTDIVVINVSTIQWFKFPDK